MTVLLKQLDIHGFKSFAGSTPFVFDRGITAIIGPNGSGKSNVAEALRWVLGEQGYANLRSRRTDDVIFAGSDKRAQQTMAEVTLTLDNSDGDLPLPFAEISIARRAFRGGENQYLINGSRVRLKDIQQLVAPIGQAYTIIGQGLVDAALSQRPEERRGLFEHAAGISGLRMRANEAERGLAEAAGNAQRLHDILSELEPRVRSLERQARMAREYGAVRDQLRDLQRRYYRTLWQAAQANVDAAQQTFDAADASFEAREREHTIAAQRLAELRAEDRRIADALAGLTQRVSERDRAVADARHQRALLDAQLRSADQRAADIHERRAELERDHESATREARTLAQQREALAGDVAELERQVAEHNAALDVARRRRDELRQTLDRIDQRSVNLAREVAALESSVAGLADRRTAADTQVANANATIARATERLDAARQAIEVEEQHAEDQAAEVERATAALSTAEADAKQLRESLATRRRQVDDAAHELATLRARLDLLERTHATGDGLYAGVRAVIRAARGGDLTLPGLVGTVAEVIEAPKELETAIEVALGGHLQDLIVERWDDAQTAIDYLKRTRAGRATFQPLDTVRAPRSLDLDVRDPDLVGVAAELIRFPEQVRPVIEQAIGRTLIVRNLEAARRLLQQARGWTLVTLSGEITRPSGAVTGGDRGRDSGLLARERERRALPARIAAATTALETERDALLDGANKETAIIERIASLRGEIEMLSGQQRATRTALDRARAELNAANTAATSARDLAARAAGHARDLDSAEDQAREKLATLAADYESLTSERAAIVRHLEAADEHVGNTDNQIGATLAETRERLRATSAAERRLAERITAAERGIAARDREVEELAARRQQAEQERQSAEQSIANLEGLLAAATDELPTLRTARETIQESYAAAERNLDRATELIRAAERARDQDALRHARMQDEQVFLAERIRNDLGIDNPTSLGIAEEGEPPVDEREIGRLRDRLRRMSAVSEDVLEQHESEAARLAHLRQQLDDVEQAAANLRRVLNDLNSRMATQFNETFREVAVAFERTFTRLFGGGMARLVLATNDDGAASIDIVAQPPGKRLQNLTALSGGERSLTAVALLIAIQRVNPSPFCLLDEVDAALDESNVVRFRDELRDLAHSTQFVVITHNRGTIEGADTLYGVTMSGDGVSRVLSLRLEEAIRAVEEYETA